MKVDFRYRTAQAAQIEKRLSDQFGMDRGGVLLDVGAYHPFDLSNSVYFEQEKGFKTILIEPNPVMAAMLRVFRDHVYEFAASDKSGEMVEFHIVHGPHDAFGFAGSGMHTYEGVRGQTTPHTAFRIKPIRVKTITIDDVCLGAGAAKLDVLLMDIEGHEMTALRGCDLRRWRPAVCCIENYFSEPDLIKHMADNGYVCFSRVEYDDLFVRTD